MYDDRHSRRPRRSEELAMPMIEVTAPAGAIAPESREELLDELAGRLLHWEGAPDTEFFREISWVYFNELPADGLHVGGRPGGEPRVGVEITTPEGALSQRRRAGLVGDVHSAVARAMGVTAEEAGLRVWVLCREIAEGSWGAAGAIVEFAKLREASKAERERVEAGAPV
jgi:phenylpyruvate tautomerase PptA (4-oxalocrotonate tautomerase family)